MRFYTGDIVIATGIGNYRYNSRLYPLKVTNMKRSWYLADYPDGYRYSITAPDGMVLTVRPEQLQLYKRTFKNRLKAFFHIKP